MQFWKLPNLESLETTLKQLSWQIRHAGKMRGYKFSASALIYAGYKYNYCEKMYVYTIIFELLQVVKWTKSAALAGLDSYSATG